MATFLTDDELIDAVQTAHRIVEKGMRVDTNYRSPVTAYVLWHIIQRTLAEKSHDK